MGAQQATQKRELARGKRARVNDWPDIPCLYTMLIDGQEVIYEDDWPEHWERPAR